MWRFEVKSLNLKSPCTISIARVIESELEDSNRGLFKQSPFFRGKEIEIRNLIYTKNQD